MRNNTSCIVQFFFYFRYTKTVVVLGRDMQKYNPEVKPMTNLENIDPRVADLVDKLRHVHHVSLLLCFLLTVVNKQSPLHYTVAVKPSYGQQNQTGVMVRAGVRTNYVQ